VSTLEEQISALRKNGTPRELVLEEALRGVLEHFHSETGTLHRLDAEKQMLHLVAQVGLPPQMLELVKTIPVGKGIAGEVVARNAPVSICNLQTDAGRVAKPGARQSGVGGALCVPARDGDKIIGTLGIGTLRPYHYTPEETRALEEMARAFGHLLKS